MADPKLKLGNDIWATKQKSLLAYNDEGGNFKSLPFQVDRISGGTYVGRNGLIQSAASNEPRIDFLNNTKGGLLLEPQRTNSLIYSDDFSQSSWLKINTTATDNQIITPSGILTGGKVQRTSTSASYFQQLVNQSTSGNYYSISVWVKKGNSDRVAFRLQTNFPDRYDVRFVFSTESIEYDQVFGDLTNGSCNVVKYPNDWYRIEITVKTASDNTQARLALSPRVSTGNIDTTDTSSDAFCYIWGAQLETSGNTSSGYPTSYIPTSSAAVTRVKDEVANGGNQYIFDLTEGTFFLDLNPFIPTANTTIGISNGSDAQKIIFIFQTNGTQVRTYSSGGVSQYDNLTFNQRNKIAVSFKTNEYKIFINGTNVGTDTSASVPTGMNRLNFSNRSNTSSYFEGEIYQTKIYNEALSDSELATLTTI
jgi:hypothetical protein